jgi:hypothetical protein
MLAPELHRPGGAGRRTEDWPDLSNSDRMRATLMRSLILALSFVLAACSEGSEGTSGPAGPPGKDGLGGAQGAQGPAGSTAAVDAGPSARPSSLSWKDATGALIPVVAISDSTFNNDRFPFSWLYYVESDGSVWSIATSTGQIFPAQISPDIAALAYVAAGCVGTAYVTTALPARVTFKLANDPDVRYIKDNAVVSMNTSFASYQVSFGGPCTNNGLNANMSVPLTDTASVSTPAKVFKLPLRPEISK